MDLKGNSRDKHYLHMVGLGLNVEIKQSGIYRDFMIFISFNKSLSICIVAYPLSNAGPNHSFYP